MSRLPPLAHDQPDAADAAGKASSRRIHARLAIRRPIGLVMADGSVRSATTVDVSQVGLSMTTDKPIAPGSKCQVRLEWHSGGALQSVALAAKSVYSSYTSPKNFRIGLLFVEARGVDLFLQELTGSAASLAIKSAPDKP
ncbi:PilZ domain-containing protein [Aquabacterium sp.]|uniref:PilZ domain-containing protein n=1 Tax=Aquabacterium sp. TaxID=1872578 RepID=UPI00198758DD|nr:PilZ domain-containing protein [Aquabacterium sp.]MBC7702184.1 PilZ domain-containing protein [Aquabacterium sp.]